MSKLSITTLVVIVLMMSNTITYGITWSSAYHQGLSKQMTYKDLVKVCQVAVSDALFSWSKK